MLIQCLIKECNSFQWRGNKAKCTKGLAIVRGDKSPASCPLYARCGK